uniref:Uncharacterized protein n=1 Tax=Triticum urartu TaxID=4572 RepID=A0A8R7R8I1_TRIUA
MKRNSVACGSQELKWDNTCMTLMPTLTNQEGPGKCFRLFQDCELDKTAESTIPEIKPCNLANIVLQPNAIGTGDIIDFHFMKKPSSLMRHLGEVSTMLICQGFMEQRQV